MPGFVVAVAGDAAHSDAQTAQYQSHLGVGTVRLDNRSDIARWTTGLNQYAGHDRNSNISDLALVVRAVACAGAACISRLHGDFAFIVWDTTTDRALAACDPFGVKKLYWANRADGIALASHAELLARLDNTDGAFDVQYLSELLAYCTPSDGRTAYAGVRIVPPGTVAHCNAHGLTSSRYWSALEVATHEGTSIGQLREAATIDTFRGLLADAVATRLTGRGDTWAHLSGGLDSSSVVSTAQWLAGGGAVSAGVSGTISWVYPHGTGADERAYSDAVVQKYGIRNEAFVETALWQDDGLGPPRLDQPTGGFAFYARDRRAIATIKESGGRVLLTGVGGDNLVAGNMFFFADQLAQGQFRAAIADMLYRAAVGRVSFWELAYRNALMPLLPRALQRTLVHELGQVPGWIPRPVVRRYDLRNRALATETHAGPPGHKYAYGVAHMVDGIASSLPVTETEEMLDVRHPFLSRPLVEFALQLPPAFCVRPHQRKWILREAMRGILPERVRNRVGKGTTYGTLAWSVAAERPRLERLAQDSILAQLGCVDATRFRAALIAATTEHDGRQRGYADVQHALGIEAWLQVHTGRWAAGERRTSAHSHDRIGTNREA